MKTLKAIFQFYVQSSLHVSFSVCALAGITVNNFGISAQPDLVGFIFFGTIVGYNFVKYGGFENLHHLNITPNLQLIRILTGFALLACIYFAFQLDTLVLWISFGLGLITLLYVLPAFRGSNLRSIKGMKVYVIAFVWAATTVLMPLAGLVDLFTPDVFLELTQRFLFVIVLMLPFEIRDLKYDAPGLKTIPQQLGIRNTKYLGYVLLFFIILIELPQSTFNIELWLVLLFVMLITGGFVYHANIVQSRYYTSFWIEGIPVLWWGFSELVRAGLF